MPSNCMMKHDRLNGKTEDSTEPFLLVYIVSNSFFIDYVDKIVILQKLTLTYCLNVGNTVITEQLSMILS